MERREEQQIGTNDLGLLLFVTVSLWLIVIYSGWF